MGQALDQFNESVELAISLKKLEREKYPRNPTIKQQAYVKGLRGGATVLMVAAFEFFLRCLFEENIQKLNSIPASIDFNKLPDKLKVKSIFDGLTLAINGPRFADKPPKVDRINDVIASCKLIISGQVNPSAFSETGNNPNGETVNLKFKEIGIDTIFSKIKTEFEREWKYPVADDFIKEKLNEIVRTRNVVAHTADTLNISRRTQNEALKFLKILAKLLEKKLISHMNHLRKIAKISRPGAP